MPFDGATEVSVAGPDKSRADGAPPFLLTATTPIVPFLAIPEINLESFSSYTPTPRPYGRFSNGSGTCIRIAPHRSIRSGNWRCRRKILTNWLRTCDGGFLLGSVAFYKEDSCGVRRPCPSSRRDPLWH